MLWTDDGHYSCSAMGVQIDATSECATVLQKWTSVAVHCFYIFEGDCIPITSTLTSMSAELAIQEAQDCNMEHSTAAFFHAVYNSNIIQH